MVAPRQKHGKWMTPSASEQQCRFLKLKKDDVGVVCGVTYVNAPSKTDQGLRDLIPKGTTCSQEVMDRMRQAHDGPMRTLLKPMQETKSELHWPFYVNHDTGDIEDDGIGDTFWKSIVRKPGKARHDGFHLAILGRLQKE
jgi:hypothetical protein